jgi:hypothetical protein
MPISPAMLPMLTMLPAPFAAILGANAATRKYGARTLLANNWSNVPTSRSAVGPNQLEPAEHLFVSPHTVNSHLRHAFIKLGVNSRVELARVAAEWSTTPVLD